MPRNFRERIIVAREPQCKKCGRETVKGYRALGLCNPCYQQFNRKRNNGTYTEKQVKELAAAGIIVCKETMEDWIEKQLAARRAS